MSEPLFIAHELERKTRSGEDSSLEEAIIEAAYKQAVRDRRPYWSGTVCRSATDRALSELQQIDDRIVWLLGLAEAKEAAGADCTAELDEAERLIHDLEVKAAPIAHNGKIAIFEPKHGRFGR